MSWGVLGPCASGPGRGPVQPFRRMPCCFCPGGAPIGVQTYSIQLPAKNDVPPEASLAVKLSGVLYLGAGFWKLNTAFLDLHVSCAHIFTASLATRLPEWLTPPWLLRPPGRRLPAFLRSTAPPPRLNLPLFDNASLQ